MTERDASEFGGEAAVDTSKHPNVKGPKQEVAYDDPSKFGGETVPDTYKSGADWSGVFKGSDDVEYDDPSKFGGEGAKQ